MATIMHNTSSLYQMLKEELLQINQQLAAAAKDAERFIDRESEHLDPGTTIYDIKNSDGSFILSDMICAKAQVLSAMANLKASEGKR